MKTLLLFALVLIMITAKANTYYFSTASGDDSRSSLEAQNSSAPWKTLNKLNSIFNSLQAGDSILLNKGEIYYGSIVVNKSGTAKEPIVIGTYGTGLNPVITGMVNLTWFSAGTNLWSSNETLTNTALNMVTANGLPVSMGRWPNIDNQNGGYNTVRSSNTNTITDVTGLKTAPSAGKPSYFIGAELVLRSQRWLLDRHPITGYNTGNSTIQFDPASSNETPKDNLGYFIQNDSTVLDKQNEWWYNSSNRRLKMYSVGAPVNISAATKENFLISSNKSYITVDNITFNGCNADAINIISGSNFIIQNCTFQDIGRNAINTTTPYSSFLNNTMADVMSKGIWLRAGALHNIVRYNKMRNISQIPGLGTSQTEDGEQSYSGDGVYIKENGATVEYNSFVKMGYAAVHLTKVDSATIKYNFIDTVCNVFDDGGAIYSYTGNAYTNYGRKISNNIILHGIGAPYGSGVAIGSVRAGASVAGIYNDRGTSDIEIDSNTIAYFEKGILNNYGCKRLKMRSNTFYKNYNGLQINTRLQKGDKTRNLYITRNIAVAVTMSQTTMNVYSSDGDVLNQFGTIDSNYYARPINDVTTISWQTDQGSNNVHDGSLSQWQGAFPVYDPNSKKSPKAISDTSQLRFEYNATNSGKTISLNGSYTDVKGNTKSNSITLQPFTSAILIKTSSSVQNLGPKIAITSPVNNTAFVSPASININAVANDSDGLVAKVDFYNGSTLLASDTASPFTFTWKNVPAGNYTLIARATDNGGLVTTSDTINVSVSNPGVAPTVSITGPANYTAFTSPASISINAVSGDSGGLVTKVDFYADSLFLGSAYTSPYTFTWNNVAAGNYALTAKATSNSGLVTASDIINVSVDTAKADVAEPNAAPTVSITSPVNNSSFTLPASINISASAADSNGLISKVEFYNGTTLLGSDSTSPYAFTWSDVAAGNYSLTAKATNNKGLITTSGIVSVNVDTIVVYAEVTPTVSITSPVNNTSFSSPASININANVSGSNGDLTIVSFYNGAALLGSDSTSPYAFTWSNVPSGNYSLTVKATVNDSLVTTSDSIFVSVANPNTAPTVSITSPVNNAPFTAPASINITANASDSNGSVKIVSFYNGASLLGSDSTSPYAFTWSNVSSGNYSLTAKATDNSGLITTSDTINISVAKSATAPTVSITSPVNNASFRSPASINITANASDSNGSVKIVSFYNGTTLLGSDSTSPYSFTWNNVTAGNYSLTAKATDNSNLTTTSSAVAVVVKVNAAPKVSITSPASNAVFTAPASINISAAASDTDGSIVKVNFYNGSTFIGSDSTSPYSFTWSNVAPGNYSLIAKATDNGGSVTASPAVSIVVKKRNIPPTVTITSPSVNSGFVAPASMTIIASAIDSDGSIAKVELYNGNVLLSIQYTNPYRFVWNNIPAGTYVLTAKATDNGGSVTSSKAVIISVIKANVAPTVSITSPSLITSFIAPASVNITASAADADGSIAKVDFYNGSALLGTDKTSPYSFSWSKVPLGTYALTVKATDNAGLVSYSTAVIISVVKTNAAPAVSITGPSPNAGFIASGSVNITASASDADGSIAKVDFYNGTTLLGTDNTSPYSFTWNNLAAGTYALTVKATDNGGLVTSSKAVNILVIKGNIAPKVSITSPVANAAFTAPASINITASASDADGSIAKVEFYNGSTLLGTDNTSPYSFTWSKVPAGSYALTAKATDNTGLATYSTAVIISVGKAAMAKSSAISDNAATAANGNVYNGISNNLNLEIGPNPASNELSIYITGPSKGKKANISILTISGRLIKTFISPTASQVTKVNVSTFTAGVYLVRLTTDGLVICKQFEKL